MTVACPNGHSSTTTDYCDQCGAPIIPARASAESQAAASSSDVDEADTSPARPQEPCPACGAPRSGDDRYCEGCGHDFRAPVQAAAIWEAIATADFGQFQRSGSTELSFPTGYSERRFALDGPEMRIGRSRGESSTTGPALEIDLAGPDEDPGISRLHAILERREDGTYSVRDLGSTNGTTVNDDPTPVRVDAALPIADGDRIRLGAWTTITVRSCGAPPAGVRSEVVPR
jgi:hypothetical protein